MIIVMELSWALDTVEDDAAVGRLASKGYCPQDFEGNNIARNVFAGPEVNWSPGISKSPIAGHH